MYILLTTVQLCYMYASSNALSDTSANTSAMTENPEAARRGEARRFGVWRCYEKVFGKGLRRGVRRVVRQGVWTK